MKKILAICLAVILVVSAGVLAFAQGGFFSSPSGNDAPTIVEIIYEDGSCKPKVIVTPYSESEDLEDEKEMSTPSNVAFTANELEAIAFALEHLHDEDLSFVDTNIVKGLENAMDKLNIDYTSQLL